MIYAFILLSIVAALTWSAWGGAELPKVDTARIQERLFEVYETTRDRVTGAVKEKAKKELHEVIEEKIQ